MKKDKKVILHFLKTGEYSGAENVVITIINEITKRFNYKCIYVSVAGNINRILKENGIEHVIIKKNSVKEYQRVISRYNPDVIQAHDFSASVLVAWTKSRAIKISHLHNNPKWLTTINVKSVLYRMTSKSFDYILGVSESIYNEYCFKKVIKDKYMVIGNPVNIEKIKYLAECAVEQESSDILFLGRLETPKNPVRFLEIINLCREKKKDICALLIGNGNLLSECQKKIEYLELEKNVRMVGFKQNPYGYLKNTKVLCVPSVWEGYGLVVVEAFSLGIPVVAANVGGMRNLVTSQTGALCNTNDEMIEEIMRLLNDSTYYSMKSSAAKERSYRLDNLDKYIKDLDAIYKKERN